MDIGWVAWTVRTLLYVLLTISLALTPLGLGGNFVMVGLMVLYALLVGFGEIGLWFLLLLLALAILGEIVEALLGLIYVAKKGATRYGVLGSFLGGIGGAILGSSWLPLVGTLIGGFVGAFVGAVAGEWIAYRRIEEALPTGFAAFVGKVLASTAKLFLGLAILALSVWRTLP